MSTHGGSSASGDDNLGDAQPKEVAGIPYDWRRPTKARIKSRMWNPEEPRMFPPKSFGAGWTINFFWLLHLRAYFAQQRSRSQ